ncbi:MAG: KH domain-containing protein [Candidatus Pacebacteria bacterium]|nr:KH domain-containing protein [Candidatus Paceibacterota bacterium]
MVLDFLKNVLGLQKGQETASPADIENDEDRLIAFVTFVVKNIVDSPEHVNIDADKQPQNLKIRIQCEKSDIGKVIGKRGKTISAIRSLATGAARRDGIKVSVDVLD